MDTKPKLMFTINQAFSYMYMYIITAECFTNVHDCALGSQMEWYRGTCLKRIHCIYMSSNATAYPKSLKGVPIYIYIYGNPKNSLRTVPTCVYVLLQYENLYSLATWDVLGISPVSRDTYPESVCWGLVYTCI